MAPSNSRDLQLSGASKRPERIVKITRIDLTAAAFYGDKSYTLVAA